MHTYQSGPSHNEPILEANGLAAVTLTAIWSDGIAEHEDRKHFGNFSVFREIDLLPPDIASKLIGMRPGNCAEQQISADEIVGEWLEERQIVTDMNSFDSHYQRGLVVTPHAGRFYPQGYLHGTRDIVRETIAPMRVIKCEQNRLTVDLNHPLARIGLVIRLQLDDILPGYDRRGGRCNSLVEDLLQYNGFAASLRDGRETDYGDFTTRQTRRDDKPDSVFYSRPRMVQHLDARALSTINQLYRKLIPAQAEVLDLMASHDSHLHSIPWSKLHALGMNKKELATNKSADRTLLQDLNKTTRLPFENNSLDAIVCTASIEYLIEPLKILKECLRVLRPEGVLVVTFSNRWFPTKAIKIWSELHEFERLGMVTQWLKQSDFVNLQTFSSRGLPRPADDKYADKTPFSDPIYAAWGYKTPASL